MDRKLERSAEDAQTAIDNLINEIIKLEAENDRLLSEIESLEKYVEILKKQ